MTISNLYHAALLAGATYRDKLEENSFGLALSENLTDPDLTQDQSGDEKYAGILPLQLLSKS
jgi:hypothetical protein